MDEERVEGVLHTHVRWPGAVRVRAAEVVRVRAEKLEWQLEPREAAMLDESVPWGHADAVAAAYRLGLAISEAEARALLGLPESPDDDDGGADEPIVVG